MMRQEDIAQLRAFHAAHFPGQPIPQLTTTQHQVEAQSEPDQLPDIDHDGLGYYDDGAKRTLTDEQIKMFRHSEIQRLLNERRAAREKDETRMDMEAGRGSSVTRNSRKHRFYDEPSTNHQNVDALVYDEQPESQSVLNAAEKEFLWPVLGQRES
ncbi:hypothetical protein A1O7_07488 [Cladophialophora yegresii CBS 114405]|uniref:Uncharacterized protein n=1 Tax=Cladophialophora yegresii CBS 114405 TaxID=1182544 RepID=W9VNN0_9EURO|nr:uncharacterized protein A1O7_07488 [Cladophialophora yegresii CBS 114405]EXJ57143.1 hypothetical protein A1O7_07488 [Cladophialophora yegresii CBS 114405]